MKMSPGELRDYVRRLSVEGETVEGYLMEVALYSDGVISYGELLSMPMPKVKLFEKRLSVKLQAKSGKSGPEYL